MHNVRFNDDINHRNIKEGDIIEFNKYRDIISTMKIIKITKKYFWSDYHGGLKYKQSIRSLNFGYFGLYKGVLKT